MITDYEFITRVVILGDSAVGKTSLCKKITSDVFNEDYISTIGVDFFSQILRYQEKNFKVQIWDTAGQERFRNIITPYINTSKICLVVFDYNNLHSFKNIVYWIDKIKELNKESEIILVGNKNDLPTQIKDSDIDILVKLFNIKFFSISLKYNQNIDNLLQYIVNSNIEIFKTINLQNNKKISKFSCLLKLLPWSTRTN